MTQIARINDIVVGYCNGSGHQPGREFVGVWITSSDNESAESQGIIRVGDIGTTDCGHTFVAATGSDQAFSEGKALHRIDDIVLTEGDGIGVTLSGSDNTTAGE